MSVHGTTLHLPRRRVMSEKSGLKRTSVDWV